MAKETKIRREAASAKRGDTAWTKAAREGVQRVIDTFGALDREQLRDVGIYREKLASYRGGQHLPSSASLIAALIVFELPLEVQDPATGDIWLLRMELASQRQLSFDR